MERVLTARHSGRHGRPWRRIRAQILAASSVCWLCGHDGADSVDHLVPRALLLASGQHQLLEDPANLRPAHHQPCPTCGVRCNRKRGMGVAKRKTVTLSRQW